MPKRAGGAPTGIGSRFTFERRWIILICVGWLPPDFTSSRSCLCLVAWVGRSQGGPPLIGASRVLLTGHPPPECLMPDTVRAARRARRSDRRPAGVRAAIDLAGDRPDEPDQLPRHRRGDLVLRLAGVNQMKIPGAQPLLRRPGQRLHRLRRRGRLAPQVRGLARRKSITPRRLHQHPPSMPVAGLGNRPLAPARSRRPFARITHAD